MRQVRKSFSDLGNSLNSLADNLVHAARSSFREESPDWDVTDETAAGGAVGGAQSDDEAAVDLVRRVMVAATGGDWGVEEAGGDSARVAAEASDGGGGPGGGSGRKALAAWMQKRGTRFPHPWQARSDAMLHDVARARWCTAHAPHSPMSPPLYFISARATRGRHSLCQGTS